MPGSLVDLSQADSRYPSTAVLDTNVLVIHFLTRHDPKQHARAQLIHPMFQQITAGNVTGCVTSHTIRELLHKFIIMKLEQELRTNRATHEPYLKQRWPNLSNFSWRHLIKAQSRLLRSYAADMDRLCQLMIASGVVLLQPGDITPWMDPHTMEQELVRYIKKYRLDTTDAAILIEARGAGINSIVTMDGDLKRARSDFHIYTWL